MEKLNIGLTIRQTTNLLSEILDAHDKQPVNSDVMCNIIDSLRGVKNDLESACTMVAGVEELEKIDLVRDVEYLKLYDMLEVLSKSHKKAERSAAEVLFKIIDGEKYNNYMGLDCQKKYELGGELLKELSENFEHDKALPMEFLLQSRNFALSLEAFHEDALNQKLTVEKMENLRKVACSRYDIIWFLNGNFMEFINSSIEAHPVFFGDFGKSLDEIVAKYNELSLK